MITSSDTTPPLRFDLDRGRIHNREGDGFLLLPVTVMSELCRSLPEDSLSSFGYAVGTEIGRRLAATMGEPNTPSLNRVVDLIGSELATAGLGTLGLELWGRALVFTLKDSPLTLGGGEVVDRADPMLGALLSGILMRAFGRDANVIPLGRTSGTVRFVVCSPQASEQVEGWVNGNVSSGEILSRLNQGAAQ